MLGAGLKPLSRRTWPTGARTGRGAPCSWVFKSPVYCCKLLSLPITRINCHCQDEAKLTGTGSRQEVHVGQIEFYRGWTGSPHGTDRKSTG